jgi:Histidine kinase
MPSKPSLVSGTDDLDRPPGYPFRGPGLLVRVAPFAAIAALAEASLALTPGPAPVAAVAVSLVVLFAVAAAFALPWEVLPGWLSVLMPLAYTGSVLALILAAGSASGVGIVILVPLIWTALFHRRWESGCILVAIIAVEVIISLMPVAAPGGVIARRVILWAALGTVVAVATHELRERSGRARKEADLLHDQLTQLTLVQDRDRIAADLQDKVIQQVFAIGMSLHSTAMLATQPEVRKRILASANDLDEVLRLTRDAVFDLERQLQGRGLRAEIVALCEEVSPVPEVSFTGPVDGALAPGPRRATRAGTAGRAGGDHPALGARPRHRHRERGYLHCRDRDRRLDPRRRSETYLARPAQRQLRWSGLPPYRPAVTWRYAIHLVRSF